GLGEQTGPSADRSQPSFASTCCTSRLGPCRRICCQGPGAYCVLTVDCSSMAPSCAMVLIPLQAMQPSTPVCGRKIRHGACATLPICARSERQPAFRLPKSRRCRPTTWCWRSRGHSGTIDQTQKTETYDFRTDPRHCSSRPCRTPHSEVRGKPQVLRRRHGYDAKRREGRQRLFPRMGRLRALFAQTDGVEHFRAWTCRLPHSIAASAGAPRRCVERVGV